MFCLRTSISTAGGSTRAFAPLPYLQHSVQAKLNTLIQRMTALSSEQRPGSIQEIQNTLHEVSQLYYQRPGIFYTAAYQPVFYTIVNPTMITPGVVPGSLLNNQAGGGVTLNYYYPQQQQQMYQPSAQPLPSFKPPTNIYARISVICGIVSILWPIFLCSNISYALASNITSVILFYLVLLTPSLLGVICGHKGRNFAMKRRLKTGTATTGLMLSAISTAIYIVLGLFFLIIFTSRFYGG